MFGIGGFVREEIHRFWFSKHRQQWNFMGEYTFENRAKGCEKLLLILAGYKEFLYEDVFSRIEKYIDKDIDVCICVSGKEDSILKNRAKKNNWSYLSTKEDRLALAQNLAIREHPKAEFIYKLDEDIFISKGYFKGLKHAYDETLKLRKYKIGFVCPLINVNGYGYRIFLEYKKKVSEYQTLFGDAISAAEGIPAHKDGKAAEYLWKQTFPFDQTASEISRDCAHKISICNHRFSIGAILLTRAFWEEIGGFEVAAGVGAMGAEEEAICKYCMIHSYAIVCAEDVFAGHFAFGPQTPVMKEFYRENKELFR